MKGRNKGIRLAFIYAPFATEVVSAAIRPKIRYAAATTNPCLNRDFLDYDDSHDFNHINHINHINHRSAEMRCGNPLGLSRSVEGVRPCHPASRSGCNPNGMQRPVWGYLSTERCIPTGCRPASANDTRIVNVHCLNHDFLDYNDSHDFNHTNHINHRSAEMRCGNPLGLSRSVECLRLRHPASRSGCNPNGMQRPVWGYLSTERCIPTGCRPASANDARIVNVHCLNHDFLEYDDSHEFNPVNHVNHGSDNETRFIASAQSQTAPLSVTHHTPPAPSPEGKGEAVDAAESGVRYTYIYCFSKSLPSSLMEKNRERSKMPMQTCTVNAAEMLHASSDTTAGDPAVQVSPVGDSGGFASRIKCLKYAKMNVTKIKI
jgi:hypothetical protein